MSAATPLFRQRREVQPILLCQVPGVDIKSLAKFDSDSQLSDFAARSIKFPCYPEKIPCYGGKNSLFRCVGNSIVNCRMRALIRHENRRGWRILQNSLLISLLAENLLAETGSQLTASVSRPVRFCWAYPCRSTSPAGTLGDPLSSRQDGIAYPWRQRRCFDNARFAGKAPNRIKSVNLIDRTCLHVRRILAFAQCRRDALHYCRRDASDITRSSTMNVAAENGDDPLGVL